MSIDVEDGKEPHLPLHALHPPRPSPPFTTPALHPSSFTVLDEEHRLRRRRGLAPRLRAPMRLAHDRRAQNVRVLERRADAPYVRATRCSIHMLALGVG